MKQYDIIVVGGGISGVMAAVAAARQGASVLLVEQHAYLGGMLTAAGVGPMMTFHAGDNQVIQGLAAELIARLEAEGCAIGHILDTTGYTYTVTPFDSEGMKRVLEQMATQAGCTLLYHTMLAQVSRTQQEISHITLCNKAGLTNVAARIFIDATGDGDLSAWAGVPCTKGRASDGLCQPATMCLKFGNVDVAALKAYARANPQEFPEMNQDINVIDRAPRLCLTGFTHTMQRATELGMLGFVREKLGLFETSNAGEFIINTTRILRVDATDPINLSQAEQIGRQQAHEIETILRQMVPGFAHAVLMQTGPNLGVRTSRQIIGCYTITLEDLIENRRFPDTIAHAGYRADIHPPDGAIGAKKEYKQMKNGKVQSVPYRCLINPQIHNLITVGRCISASFEAIGALRTTPTAAAIGQAGGTAAALALACACNTHKVDVTQLQQALRTEQAYLE